MQRLRSTFDPLRPAVHLAPVKPAFASGFRVAVATVGPPLIGYLLGLPALSWMGLGGFLVALADKEGSYRTRAVVMCMLTFTAAVSATIAAVAAHYAVLAVVLMLLWAVFGGLARAYGTGATSIGASTAIVFAISAATPARGFVDAMERGGFILVGGAWAMLLALALWPIAYYRPARASIAEVYRALADFADDIARYATRIAEAPQPEDDHHRGARLDQQLQEIDQRILFQRDPAHIRETLEIARATLATTRRGRSGESGRGERLLIILEGADQMFRALVSLADLLEDLAYAENATDASRALQEALGAYAETAREIITVLEIDGHPVALPELTWSGDVVRGELGDVDAHTKAQYEYVAGLINRLQQYTTVVAANAATLETERPVPDDSTLQVSSGGEEKPDLFEPLRATLAFDSVVLRHAIRLGIVTALAIWITRAFSLSHGYWVTLTVIVILQPYLDDTILKGVQRVGGTILGGILAAVLAGVLQGEVLILAVVFVLVVISVALMPINYGVFAIFSTCTFILLAEMSSQDWHIIEARVINTLIGGAISLIAIRFLWPSWERKKFPDQMAAALRANSLYLRRVVAAAVTGDAGIKEKIMATRRQVGLAELNAEASFQRVITEAGRGAPSVEPAMAVLLYTRRVGVSITTLSSAPWENASAEWRETLSNVGRGAHTMLDSLAASIEHGRKPDPFLNISAMIRRPADESADDPALLFSGTIFRSHLERLVRQLRVLHDAVQRTLEVN